MFLLTCAKIMSLFFKCPHILLKSNIFVPALYFIRFWGRECVSGSVQSVLVVWSLAVACSYIPLGQITNLHCAVFNVNPFSRGIIKQISHSLFIAYGIYLTYKVKWKLMWSHRMWHVQRKYMCPYLTWPFLVLSPPLFLSNFNN